LAHLFEKTSTDELIGKGDMPVIVVPREHQSLFERWGIPFLGAGLAAGLATAVID
jgi:hypothetical protein